MRNLILLGFMAATAFGVFADCYKMDNATGSATLGDVTYIDSTDRFIIFCGTVTLDHGCFIRSGGNSNNTCNFIGIDRDGKASVLNINGGTFWCSSAKGAGYLGVGNNNNKAQATVNVNSGVLKVDTMLRCSTMWNGTTAGTSSGTVNVNGGEVTVKEFYIGASTSSTGTGTLNLQGGITRTQRITLPAYNGQVLKFNGGILEAQAANIFNFANYAGSLTRTVEVVNGKTTLFRTGGFDQTIPAMTGTGYLRLTGGGTVTFAEKELTYGLVLDGVGLNLGLLDANTPALKPLKVEFRAPLALTVSLPENPTGKYPLIANCETVTAAGVMESATVVGGGAGKLVYQDKTIYLDFGGETTEGLILSDPAGGAFTPEAASYTSLVFGKTAGEYTLGGNGLIFTFGFADAAPGRQTVTSPVTVTTANETAFVAEGSTLEFAGGLTANAQIVKDGKGTLALSHATRPGTVTMREGTIDLGGGTYTGKLDYWSSRRAFGSAMALTNGVYRPAAQAHVYYPDATLKLLDGFTLDLRANDLSRIALGYTGVNQTDKLSKLVIDGGTFYTAGNQSSNCNFINPDHNGTAELTINRGAFYATTANGGTLRIATGNNRNTIGYVRLNGGLLQLDRDLTLATQYNSTSAGSGHAFFEQTGGVAQIAYFYLGFSNSGVGEGTVTLTGGELKVKMLKCLQYGTQTLLCDGAKITALQNDSDSIPFMTQLGDGDSHPRHYTIGAHGLEINTAGFNVRDDLPFAGAGGMAVTGGGILNINCKHTFGGAFTVGDNTTVKHRGMPALRSDLSLGAHARFQVTPTADAPTAVLPGELAFGEDAKLVFDMGDPACATTTFTANGGFTLPEGATSVLDFVEVSDPGKYEVSVSGDMLTVRFKNLSIPVEAVWTGNGDAGNLADSRNWECRNAAGAVLANAVPTDETTVHVTGTTSFSFPAAATFAHRAIVVGNPSVRRTTQMARAAYGQRSDMGNLTWTSLPLSDYLTYADESVANLNGNLTTWQVNTLKQSQLRFEGWFFVPADKAGDWSIQQRFDDYFAFYIDDQLVVRNPTYTTTISAACTMTEGWHRFKIVCGDTYGGQGSTLTLNGTSVPMVITCNGSSFALHTLAFGNEPNTVVLDADCDWRGLGPLAMDNALVIDLAGHKLALAGFTNDGSLGARFINSAPNTTAELTFDIPEGATLNNTEVSIDGNIKLVKAGAGTYTTTKFQNYTGGTLVAAGILKMGRTGSMPGLPLFGPNTASFRNTITVDADATLDIGSGAVAWGYHAVTLNGGTIRGVTIQPNFALQVTADSLFDASPYGADVGQDLGTDNSRGIFPVLNGHQLEVKVANAKSFFVNGATGPGTIKAGLGGWLIFKFAITPDDPASRFSLLDTASMALNVRSALDLNDYYAAYNAPYMSGTGKMRVFGTFTPAAEGLFYGCEMQNGSTIDLSAKSAPWSLTRTVTGSSVSGNDTVTFAEGAQIAVDIHGRKITSDQAIIAWTEPPMSVSSPTPSRRRQDANSSRRTMASTSSPD